jgi:hypothetical protein
MEHMEQQRLLELLSKLAPAAALCACCCRASRLLLPPLTRALQNAAGGVCRVQKEAAA